MDYLSGDQDYLAPADSHLVELAGDESPVDLEPVAAAAADQHAQVGVPQPIKTNFSTTVFPLPKQTIPQPLKLEN